MQILFSFMYSYYLYILGRLEGIINFICDNTDYSFLQSRQTNAERGNINVKSPGADKITIG